VVFDDETRFAGPDGEGLQAAWLQASQWVAVSGLRQADGRIVASRVDVLDALAEVQLIGKLDGGRLSGFPVEIPASLSFDATADRLLVAGRLQDGVLVADRVDKDAITIVLEQASELLLEGFLFDQAMDGDIVVGGVELVLPDGFDLPPDFDSDEPVYIDAELGLDGAFYADEFMDLPDGVEEYIDLGPDMGDYFDPLEDYFDPVYEEWLLYDSLEVVE
jgi:hypothetical protein